MVRYAILLLIATSCVVVALPAAANDLPQVKVDFLASNPNNGWEYGFVDDNSNFVAYNTTFDDGQGIAGWCLNNAPGPEGDVTINYTDQPIDRYGVHWEPGQICIHSPLHGKGTIVKWTVPDSTTVSVNTQLIAQRPDTGPEVELWAGGTKLIDDKFTGSSNETSDVSASPMQYDAHDTLEKSLVTATAKGDRIKLIVKPCNKRLSSHVGVHISITATSAKGVVVTKTSFGASLPRQGVKDSSVSISTTQEVTSK